MLLSLVEKMDHKSNFFFLKNRCAAHGICDPAQAGVENPKLAGGFCLFSYNSAVLANARHCTSASQAPIGATRESASHQCTTPLVLLATSPPPPYC